MKVKVMTKKHGAVYAEVNKEKYFSISSRDEKTTMEIFVAWYRTKSVAYAGSGDTQKEALSDLIRAIDADHRVIAIPV